MPCSSSPAPGCSSTAKKSTIERDGDLGLADADGLDEHDVEARRLADEHRLARAVRDAAERAARRRRADERRSGSRASRSMRVLSPRMLPPVTGLDGSTASTATRWPALDQVQAERLDEACSCRRPAGR